MEKEKEEVQTATKEELNKSINDLMRKAFPQLAKAEDASMIVADSDTTADAAIAKAPKSQKDEARGAGRPKQISDVPQKDQDGARAKEYDKDVTENDDKEEENDEAKKQAKAIDQTSDAGHTKKSPKAPAMRPFRKGDEDFSKSYQMFLDFQEFKGMKEGEVIEKAEKEEMVSISKSELERLNKGEVKVEPLKKSDEVETLAKAMVKEETSDLRKSVEALVQANADQLAMIKSMGSKPQPSRAITNVSVLEKSVSPEGQVEAFSKSEVVEAAFNLAKAGKISGDFVTEMEMTNSISDPSVKRMIEEELRNS